MIEIVEEKQLTYQCKTCGSKIKIKGTEFSKDIIPSVKCPSCGHLIRKDFDWLWHK